MPFASTGTRVVVLHMGLLVRDVTPGRFWRLNPWNARHRPSTSLRLVERVLHAQDGPGELPKVQT